MQRVERKYGSWGWIEEAKMLRKVAPQAIDKTRFFTVIALGEAKAAFQALNIGCRQLDGTMQTFDILAGATPVAVPGAGNLVFLVGAVRAVNVGEIGGTLYIRVTDDAGAQIFYTEAYADVGGAIAYLTVKFDMPARNYGITVDVGHL